MIMLPKNSTDRFAIGIELKLKTQQYLTNNNNTDQTAAARLTAEESCSDMSEA